MSLDLEADSVLQPFRCSSLKQDEIRVLELLPDGWSSGISYKLRHFKLSEAQIVSLKSTRWHYDIPSNYYLI
jgi:hypothetical protein